jgi:serine/threonine protein kinase
VNHRAAHELSETRAGEVLAGKYRIERTLGIGAMGFVVAAHHLQLGEKFAIKLLHADALCDAERVARFAREARAAAKIKSEHVVRVIDVDALPSGAPYMVMEYLDGGDLDAWVAQNGALPVEQAIEFMLQACVAVADAHALGIVHRDLKPSNLFCVRRSDGQLCIKLLDFGISKLDPPHATVRLPAERTVDDGEAMGSPAYMSPEQIFSPAAVDTRSDIWSLGVILFELLTADAPFTGKTTTELVSAIGTGPLPSLRALRPDVPGELEAVIAKCLAKQPAERYADVAELASALAPYAPERAAPLAPRVARIVSSSRAAAARLPPPPFSLNFAAFRGLPEPAGRTQRMHVARARWSQLGLGLVFVAALVAFMAALWSRSLSAPGERVVHTTLPRGPKYNSVPSLPVVSDTAPSLQSGSAPVRPRLATDTHPAPALISAPPARSSGRRDANVKPPTRSTPAPVRPTPRQARCEPPYYFDGSGNRLFKKECV